MDIVQGKYIKIFMQQKMYFIKLIFEDSPWIKYYLIIRAKKYNEIIIKPTRNTTNRIINK